MTITNVTIISHSGIEPPAVIDQRFGIVTLHEGEEQPWVRALRASMSHLTRRSAMRALIVGGRLHGTSIEHVGDQAAVELEDVARPDLGRERYEVRQWKFDDPETGYDTVLVFATVAVDALSSMVEDALAQRAKKSRDFEVRIARSLSQADPSQSRSDPA